MELKSKIDEYVELRNQKDKLNASLKGINEALKPVEQAILTGMDDMELKSIKATTGITVTVVESSFPRIADKTKVMPWMAQHGFEDLFTINAQTFRGFFNERMKNGEAVPDEGIEHFVKTTLSLKGR